MYIYIFLNWFLYLIIQFGCWCLIGQRYEGLVLSVCGDGKAYTLFLETDPSEDDPKSRQYSARFSTRLGYSRVRSSKCTLRWMGLIWLLFVIFFLILLRFLRLKFYIWGSQDRSQKLLELILNCYDLLKWPLDHLFLMGHPNLTSGRPWNIVNLLPCRMPCGFFTHSDLCGPLYLVPLHWT